MKPKNQDRINSFFSEEMKYQKGVLYISFKTRIFSIIAALIFVNVLIHVFNFPIPREISIIFYTWLLTCLGYLIFFRTGICKTLRSLDRIHFSYYFLGISYVTMIAHFLGGVEWVAFFIYLPDLIYGNVLMERGKGAIVTAFAVLSYFFLGLLEYKGLIPHHRLFAPDVPVYTNSRYFLAMSLVVVGGGFSLLSFSTGLFSKLKDERERNILDSRERFEAKSLQLEKTAKALKRKVAENVYMRRAAMGYVEKKEFELEAVRNDLEDQIEKLRKTQRSMFFMIEDLNEMSAQLKDARDHLEDKVRERTDELLNISKKLHRSERLAFLGKLAGSVTHELRNPLAVLKNAVYYLDKKFEGEKDEKVIRYIGVLKKEISLIDAIIDDIMGFAKTRPPKVETNDVGEVIENAISMLNVPELIEVKKDFKELPNIQVDPNQVMHAIINISNNAIVAMKGNGTLTFRTRRDEDFISVEIEDTGPGIPPDQRDLIFEPLFSSKPKGTGLGLPIAKMMVENQEGKVDFTSELGEGTVFRVYLPLEKRKSDQGK